MKIKSVRLKNIRSYEDEYIEFPEGTTLLSGDIGCGKSTILQAFEFALFGLKKGELEGTDLLRHGKNSGAVSVAMSIDDHDVTVERTLKRSKAITQDSCRLIIDNRPLDMMPVELKSKILEMLGYPQDLLKKNKPIFRFTVYTPQEEMKKILADEEDRLEILRSIFNIDKYGSIRNNSRLFMTELRRMRTGLEGEVKILDTEIGRIGELEHTRHALEENLAAQRSVLSQASARYDAKRSELDELKKEFANISAARHDLVRKEADLHSKEKRSEQVAADIDETDRRAEQYAQMIPSSGAPLPEMKRRLLEDEKSRENLVSRRAVLNENVRKMHGIYTQGVCGLCGQKVHNPEEYLLHINEMKAETASTEKQIVQLDTACDALKGSILTGEKAEQYRHLAKEMTDRKERLKKEMDTLARDVETLRPEIAAARPKAESYDTMQAKISESEKEALELQRAKSDAERFAARYEQQFEDTVRRIEELTEKIREAEHVKEKIMRIAEVLNWFDPFIALTETIEKHVMVAIQREFDEYFQKWFSILMGDQLSVKIDERFSPIIEQNGYVTEYGNLSGGEKTSVALAYRLSLNKVINEMIDNIKTKNLLILDEPTDGFSTDQLDRLRDVIAELALKQIIIVSHEQKVDTYVDNVIRVYKENHVSRIA